MKGKNDDRFIFDEDVEDFVKNAVLKLDHFIPLDSIDAIVDITPSRKPALTDVIRQQLVYESGTISREFSLVKKAYKDVQFDVEKAIDALRKVGYTEQMIDREIRFTISKFNDLKESDELFQMKRFVPVELRTGFIDYIKFKTEDEKIVYKELQGVNVLIFDGFYTSGSTVKEVIRYLKAINNKNTLTIFILIKQH